jgi:iron complex transport system permease protein
MRLAPILTCAAILALAMLVSLSLGKYPLPVGEVAWFLVHRLGGGGGGITAQRLAVLDNIVLAVRLPRILTAVLVGAGLSISGAAYQAMFANPLVSPDLLGVLGGASFGAVLAMVFLKSWFAVQACTFLGGLAAVGAAVLIARIYRIDSALMLILGGIISAAFFTSLVSIVKFVADPETQLPAITFWLMGDLSLADRALVLRAGLPILAGIAGLVLSARSLNVLSMGEEEARALGVNVQRVRWGVILCATLVSTLTVVLAGAVGWVGLIIPHITRMLLGPDNETLLPASALIGASYLLAVDNVSRLSFTSEVPIGISTSLVGIPFFLLVLRNARKGWS